MRRALCLAVFTCGSFAWGQGQEETGSPAARDLWLEFRRAAPDNAPARNRARALESREESALTVSAVPAWISIGPAPLTGGQTPADYTLPSDVSGRVNAIEIDPVDSSVFVGAAQGGVWKTQDNGATWTPLTDHLASLAVGALVIDRSAHTAGNATVYLGTGEANASGDSYAGVGVYKSTDSGATWTGPFGSSVFRGRSIGSLAIDRASSNVVLATTASGVAGAGGALPSPPLPPRGIYRSSDGGLSWSCTTCSGGAGSRYSNVVQDPLVATTWLAAGWQSGAADPLNGGLLKSVDNGITWSQIGGVGGLPAVDANWGRAWITAAAATGQTASTLYLGTSHGTGRIYKSIDSGASWVLLAAANNYCGIQCFYNMPVLTEPGAPSVVYHGGGSAVVTSGTTKASFRRSDNGGSTFIDKVYSPSTGTALHSSEHAIAIWPGIPGQIWTANDGGVWRSTNKGDTWINVNAGLAITQFVAGDLHPTNAAVAYAGTQGNGTNAWTGLPSWPHLDFGDGGFSLIDQSNPSRLVHTYFNQTGNLIGVGFTTAGFAVTQGGYQTSFAPANGIAISDRVLYFAPIAFDRGVPDALYFGTHRLYRAVAFFTNAGAGGEFALVRNQDLAGPTGAVSAIETFVNPSPGASALLLYTGSSDGRVFRSTNGGATAFVEVDVGGSALYVADLLINPANPQVVYQARSGFSGTAGQNVRVSVDGGVTWSPSGSGLPDIPVNALAFDPLVPGRLWAGTDIGIYVSQNGAATWAQANTGLPNVAVFDLDANPATGRLIAFTHGRGAFRLGPPAAPGEVSLSMSKVGGLLQISWVAPGATCGAASFGVYRGNLATLAAGYSHDTALSCGETAGPFAISPTDPRLSAADYFLVVASNATSEGSYGRRSSGAERAPRPSRCRPTQDLSACP